MDRRHPEPDAVGIRGGLAARRRGAIGRLIMARRRSTLPWTRRIFRASVIAWLMFSGTLHTVLKTRLIAQLAREVGDHTWRPVESALQIDDAGHEDLELLAQDLEHDPGRRGVLGRGAGSCRYASFCHPAFPLHAFLRATRGSI